MKLTYKLTCTFVKYPNKTVTQDLTITLNNVCVTSRLTNPSSLSAIYYQDGSNVATVVPGFTYTSDQLESDCNFTHQNLFRNTVNDAWSSAIPSYVASQDPSTLSITIQTSTVSIATPGDSTASRWVKRKHINPYSGQEIVQEFEIFFVVSTYCRTKTAALVSPSTLVLTDAVVGTSTTLLSQFYTNSGEFITGASTASNCQFTAAC